MNRPMDGEDSGDLLRGIMVEPASAADLIRTSRSREDGFNPSEDDGDSTASGDNSSNGRSSDSDDDRQPDSEDSDSDKKAELEKEWEKDMGSVEIIDDPVRMYLREIGRVSLLKAPQERILARNFEACKYITQLEEELSAFEGRTPRSWVCIIELLHRLCEAEQLMDAVKRYQGIQVPGTLPEVVSHPEIREALDGGLPEEMLNFVADVMNKEPDQVKAEIQALSLNSRLLPDQIFEIL